jgi:hypothetical protein
MEREQNELSYLETKLLRQLNEDIREDSNQQN